VKPDCAECAFAAVERMSLLVAEFDTDEHDGSIPVWRVREALVGTPEVEA
jgi:hypothetical protein